MTENDLPTTPSQSAVGPTPTRWQRMRTASSRRPQGRAATVLVGVGGFVLGLVVAGLVLLAVPFGGGHGGDGPRGDRLTSQGPDGGPGRGGPDGGPGRGGPGQGRGGPDGPGRGGAGAAGGPVIQVQPGGTVIVQPGATVTQPGAQAPVAPVVPAVPNGQAPVAPAPAVPAPAVPNGQAPVAPAPAAPAPAPAG